MKNRKAEFDFWHLILILIVLLLILFGWFALTGKVILGEDTDGDGLSDEKEIKIGTNITNPNTDGDRYNDGEELKLHKDPLKINSANIEVSLLEKSWDWSASFVNIISSVLKLTSPNSETVVADTKAKILIKNKGDDYSEYVNYDIIYEEEIFLKDIPNLLINSISNWNTKWDIKVANLNYESFS